jgi:Glyoxalase-like domain
MLRFRWLALLTDDLVGTVATVEQALGLRSVFTDPELADFGMVNSVIPVGDCFIEIVEPTAPESTPARFMQRRGPGGYMVVFQVDALEDVRERMRRIGVRIALEWEPRVYPAGRWESIHLHPSDVGGAIVSFDVCDPPEEFPPVAADWRAAQPSAAACDLVGLELAAADPDALAHRWSQMLDRPVDDRTIVVDNATVRFVAADVPFPRIAGVDLKAIDSQHVGMLTVNNLRIGLV